jgi:hypothetical protein
VYFEIGISNTDSVNTDTVYVNYMSIGTYCGFYGSSNLPSCGTVTHTTSPALGEDGSSTSTAYSNSVYFDIDSYYTTDVPQITVTMTT